jgi:hypothetical protein
MSDSWPQSFLRVACQCVCVSVQGVSVTMPQDMHRPLVLRPGIGMDRRKLNSVRHWMFEKVVKRW